VACRGTGPVKVSPTAVSRLVSHALRHEPWVYELELDSQGWVRVDELLTALHEKGPGWASVDREQLEWMVNASPKRRHELEGDRIRARYGHSLPGRIAKEPAAPPAVLFHGTARESTASILVEGLHPKGRQYVHLSTDIETARQVGRRKSPFPVVLRVAAAAASEAGITFYRGNNMVWLADKVPAEFIAEQ
jgi:putative RNA 2'-phosphotransferase